MAPSGQEGLRAISHKKYELVISDIHLLPT